MIPAVLIAGTHSGVGKTTVVLGLMAALRRRGLACPAFQSGAGFHRSITPHGYLRPTLPETWILS